jgi:hypothetical protein
MCANQEKLGMSASICFNGANRAMNSAYKLWEFFPEFSLTFIPL